MRNKDDDFPEHWYIAGTLATEIAEDSTQVAKLRSAMERVDHKRRKVAQRQLWLFNNFSFMFLFSYVLDEQPKSVSICGMFWK